jgi:hypothetical protein
MRLQLRAVLAVVAAVLLVTVFMPQGAQAQEAPSITVTPNTGLVDGQVIAVAGTGFVPDEPGSSGVATIVLVCPSAVLDFEPFDSDDLFGLVNVCGVLAGEASTDAGGVLASTLQVAQVMPTRLGDGVVECGDAPNDCIVFAGSVRLSPRTGPTILRYATAFITFGPSSPQSKAECKNGGWRDFANDQGPPARRAERGTARDHSPAHGCCGPHGTPPPHPTR